MRLELASRRHESPRIDKIQSNQYNAFCVQCSTHFFESFFVKRRRRNRRMAGHPKPVTDQNPGLVSASFLARCLVAPACLDQPLAT
jgi:hypothetical protein